eukprot:492888_1
MDTQLFNLLTGLNQFNATTYCCYTLQQPISTQLHNFPIQLSAFPMHTITQQRIYTNNVVKEPSILIHTPTINLNTVKPNILNSIPANLYTHNNAQHTKNHASQSVDITSNSQVNNSIDKKKEFKKTNVKRLKSCYCPQCGKHYKSECSLIEHIEKVHNFAHIQISSSGAFANASHVHRSDVTLCRNAKEFPWRCDICFKSFALKHKMMVHKNIHNGYKPHVCTICNTSYTAKSSLRTHMKHPMIWEITQKKK